MCIPAEKSANSTMKNVIPVAAIRRKNQSMSAWKFLKL